MTEKIVDWDLKHKIKQSKFYLSTIQRSHIIIILCQVQVSPVITRRLGSTNRIRDIRGTRTNEYRKKSKKKKKKKNFFFFFNFGRQGRN